MAQANSPSTADESPPPKNPFATPFTVNGPWNESEDPDDWEYEYSATETEVGPP